MQQWPKKPEKLENGSWWVSVLRAEGTGVRDDELGWATEYLCTGSMETVVLDAAKAWYHDTDQSGEAQVTFHVENWRDEALEATVQLTWVLKATLRLETRASERFRGGAPDGVPGQSPGVSTS